MLFGGGKLVEDTGCKCQQVAPLIRVIKPITYPEVRSRKHSATAEVTGVDVVPEHARPGKPVLERCASRSWACGSITLVSGEFKY